MKWPWSGPPTGRATDCAGSNPARPSTSSNTTTEKAVSRLTEWIEIEQDGFTFAVGHAEAPNKLRVRVSGRKDGESALIEWDIDAAWLRDLLVKWFPDKPPEKAP